MKEFFISYSDTDNNNTSFDTLSSLLTFFCIVVLFHSCCSHLEVFGRQLVHEFNISYKKNPIAMAILNGTCFFLAILNGTFFFREAK